MHDLITQYVVIFLEQPPADLSLEDLHTLLYIHSCLHTPHNYFGTYLMCSIQPYHDSLMCQH